MTTRHPEAPERRLTVADLERTPDDGRRYELVDGRLDVSPAPKPLHTRVAFRLGNHLGASCEYAFEIGEGPGITLNGDGTHHRIPDLAVFDTDLPEEGYFVVPPVLAVEIVSPESVFRDNHTKRREYAAFGIPSYWIINPIPEKVGIIELRLDNGEYQEVTQVYGEDVFETDLPFPVKLVPHWLAANGPWPKHIGGAAPEGSGADATQGSDGTADDA
ncbi:Uma2 family endonuclease [Nocardiopsis aegyptia]|uniref:Uma2 family endonuclease n=1 Tax=Nocardiopsis aegyptia TaxID=220378 RepID=A0A7Z0ENJ7_9ACTN|nr:Uma2 family endonuclease [Nocardiopsis aegyptia]NYJ34495.1 Uma2 family endonuclease [Nocardiopsis aegyptia]